MEEEGVDSLAVIFTVIPESRMDAAGMFASLREKYPDRALVAVLMGGDSGMLDEWRDSIESVGVPAYTSPPAPCAPSPRSGSIRGSGYSEVERGSRPDNALGPDGINPHENRLYRVYAPLFRT